MLTSCSRKILIHLLLIPERLANKFPNGIVAILFFKIQYSFLLHSNISCHGLFYIHKPIWSRHCIHWPAHLLQSHTSLWSHYSQLIKWYPILVFKIDWYDQMVVHSRTNSMNCIRIPSWLNHNLKNSIMKHTRNGNINQRQS